MKKLNNMTAEFYEFKRNGETFIVDIVTTSNMYEAWISKKDYGTKEYLFGAFREDIRKYRFVDMVAANIGSGNCDNTIYKISEEKIDKYL